MRRSNEQWEQGADKCRAGWHIRRPAENIEQEMEDEYIRQRRNVARISTRS